MGYAVRTDRYRYVEWRQWKSKQVVARELYDHDSDPHETRNVVNRLNYTETVGKLSRLLARGGNSPTNMQSEKKQ
jgi:iduronate 2-sulfatase